MPKLQGFLNYLKMLTRLFFKRADYSAIHFQFQILKGPIAWIELFFFKIIREKFVFTMHNPVPHGYSREKTYWIFHHIAQYVKQFVFVSSFSHDRFVRDYNYEGKSTIFPMGLMPLEPNEPLPEIKSSPAEMAVIFWGNVKPYKGIELLTEMVESGLFPEIQFETYGKWDPGINLLKAELENRGVTVVNRFLEASELQILLKRPAVFIFPYRDMSQSGVLYTLLFYGSLFITSDCGDDAHFARRHGMEKAIFNRNNVQSIRNALDYVIAHRKDLIEKITDIRPKYRWKNLVLDPFSIYPIQPEDIITDSSKI